MDSEHPVNDRKSSWGKTLSMVLGILAVGIAIHILFHLIPRETALEWIVEGGNMEVFGIGLYVLAAFLYPIKGRGTPVAVSGGVLLLLLALIELDPKRWHPSEKLSSLDFYLSPENPLVMRLVSFLMMVILLVLSVHILVVHRRGFWPALLRGEAATVLSLCGVVLIPVTVILDRIQKTMTWPRRGFHIDRGPNFEVGVGEEVLEFLIPLFFVAAVWVWRRGHRTS